jgi:uncharacterized membrane protein YhaH (DUF805 family)
MDTSKQEKQINKAHETRDRLQRKSFEFMLQMVFIIGIPAFLAAYFGKKIGIEKGNHPQPMIILIILAVFLSWAIILIKFFKINRALKDNNQAIKSLKK